MENFQILLDGLTPPQKYVAQCLNSGSRVVVINAHKNNGGDYMWKHPNHSNLAYGGQVYRILQGLARKVQTAQGVNIYTYAIERQK